jgi:hypothetical protein
MAQETTKVPTKSKPNYYALLLFGLVAVMLWAGNWFLLPYLFEDLAAQGQFGDKFGAVNALFTALAFAGLIYTAILQRDQLAVQQRELIEARETQTALVDRQIEAQRKLFEDQKSFQEEQRQKQVDHEIKLERLRQDFEGVLDGRRKDREQSEQDRFSRNVLRAIRSELEVVSALYDKGIDGRLEKLSENQLFDVDFSLTEDWMTVFRANAVNLGSVDGEVSRKIITVYALLKALIEEYRINNVYLSQLKRLRTTTRTANLQELNAEETWLTKVATAQARNIKQTDAALKREYSELLAMFEKRGIR